MGLGRKIKDMKYGLPKKVGCLKLGEVGEEFVELSDLPLFENSRNLSHSKPPLRNSAKKERKNTKKHNSKRKNRRIEIVQIGEKRLRRIVSRVNPISRSQSARRPLRRRRLTRTNQRRPITKKI